MLDKLLEWDKELFLLLNSKNVGWLDPIMLFLSSYWGWILACTIMLCLIYFKDSAKNKLASLFFMLSVGMSALLTNIIKLFFERPRPIHNSDWNDAIHAIEKHSTSYSFFSSHSATTFTLAIFFFLFFRNKKLYGTIAILWAAAVAYSRIYVAKHYPFDVICGIIFGILIGISGYKIYEYFEKKRKLSPP